MSGAMMPVEATPEQVQQMVTQLLVAAVTVPGEPLSKARPRVTSNGTFTPKATRDAEARVVAAWRDTHPDLAPVADWCVLEVDFYNYTKTRRDVDNMAKLVQDALNKIAYTDDWLIIDLHARKHFTDKATARTEIRLYSLAVTGLGETA